MDPSEMPSVGTPQPGGMRWREVTRFIEEVILRRKVIGMDIIDKRGKADLITIMENGLGKKTPVGQFRGQSRAGQGVKVAKVTPKTGKVVFAQVIPVNCNSVIITSKRGQVVKLEISSVPRRSRNTQGVFLMRFSNKAADHVSSATCIEEG